MERLRLHSHVVLDPTCKDRFPLTVNFRNWIRFQGIWIFCLAQLTCKCKIFLQQWRAHWEVSRLLYESNSHISPNSFLHWHHLNWSKFPTPHTLYFGNRFVVRFLRCFTLPGQFPAAQEGSELDSTHCLNLQDLCPRMWTEEAQYGLCLLESCKGV